MVPNAEDQKFLDGITRDAGWIEARSVSDLTSPEITGANDPV
jgi:hypothetical protein